VLMLMLHSYITSNVPMGVPLEWNVAVVYGGFALFWAHPDVSLLTLGPTWVAAFVVTFTLVLPILGNLRPDLISFLLSMRYYAGNWACSVWFIRKDAVKKLGSTWRCLVDQTNLDVIPPHLTDQITEMNRWAAQHGLVAAARVVKKTAVGELQSKRILRESGLGETAHVYFDRSEAWGHLVGPV